MIIHDGDAKKKRIREASKRYRIRHPDKSKESMIKYRDKYTQEEWVKLSRCRNRKSYNKLHKSNHPTGKHKTPLLKEKNPNWKGGITPFRRAFMALKAYQLWRQGVFEAFDYTCNKCGDIANVAHHLYSFKDNEELRLDVDNGVALCRKCHTGFHSMFGWVRNTKEQYEKFLNS